MEIGRFSQDIIELLNLNIPVGTPIYLGETNIQHMKTNHPDDYEKYGKDIQLIIAHPDYVGINRSDGSVEFVKEYQIGNEYVKVAVRVSTTNNFFARSIYRLNQNRVHNFIAKGTLRKT